MSNNNIDDEDIDDETQFIPPTQQTVACRALCLGALLMRDQLERLAQSDESYPSMNPAELVEKLNTWIITEGLEAYQSSVEKELIAKAAIGSWDKNEFIYTNWRYESLGIILWAISVIEQIPPYDTEFSKLEVFKLIPFMRPTQDFIESVSLRPRNAISEAREIAELWHWRSRTNLVDKAAFLGMNTTYEAVVKSTAEMAYTSGMIPTPIKNDLPAFGKSYGQLPLQEFATASSIAYERHFALNWLWGLSEDWDETPTDT